MKLRNKNTGEVVGLSIFGIQLNIRKEEQPVYHSLAELNEEWEDYHPKEPRIKDKKIRKAVRAWAALYDWSAIRVHIGEDYVALFKDEVNGYSSSVEIDLSPEVFNELIDAHYYTIEELCGEEEAPEPIEPTFIDLDERIKGKGEE